jgi:hypothetical protein
MSEAERGEQIAKWTSSMKGHWRVENEELINDGQGDYATTEKDYGDFEMLIEYKTVPKADSGIYLRGVPQVQIWDSTDQSKASLGADKGSGGLWNNSPGAAGKDPLVKADKPFGEWNKFRIVMVGARVSVWLNDKQVVDHANLENYYDRKTSVPPRGPIQLQTHGGEIRWRNIFLHELTSEEANKILSGKGEDAGFVSIFNGKDLDGWQGPLDNYEVREGAIVCKPGKGGNLLTKAEYSDFVGGSSSNCRRVAITDWRFARPRKAMPPMPVCVSCRCLTTTTRASVARSIHARHMARHMEWLPRSADINTPSDNGTSRK